MRLAPSILISLFLISCSNFGADQLEEKEQTIELSYIAWDCDCANWATVEDIRKYHDNFGDTLAELSMYIEAINESMALPDTLGYSGDLIKFTGHFYKEKGFPKGYHSFEDPEKARVFRYSTFQVIKSNYHNYKNPESFQGGEP